MTQSPTKFFVFIVTLLAAISAATAQQPATTRPPDPAATPQQAASGFKAPVKAHGESYWRTNRFTVH
jgi:hypothetical protein